MIELQWGNYSPRGKLNLRPAVERCEDRISTSTFSYTVTWDAYLECACNWTGSYNYTPYSQAWQSYQQQGMQMLQGLLSAGASAASACDTALANATDSIDVGGVIAGGDAVGDITCQWQCSFNAATGVPAQTGYRSDATDPATTPGEALANAKMLVARNKVIVSTLNRINQSIDDAGFFGSGVVGMMQYNQILQLNTELGIKQARLKDLKARFGDVVR